MAWHRRIAAAATALILDLPLTPNHITWMSLWVGWSSSVVFGLTAFGESIPEAIGYPVAGVLLFASVILDCMDGQFARARGGGTRMGRILDGAVDALVLLPFYVLVCFAVKDAHGALWFWFCAFAGITSWIQMLVYDKLKSLYLAHTLEDPSSSDAAEDMDAVMAEWAQIKEEGSLVDRALFGLYVHGQLKFSALFSGKSDAPPPRANSPEQIAAYRGAHRMTMRLVSNLGLGTHMFFLYSAVILTPISTWSLVAANLVFGIGLNAVLIVGKARSGEFDRHVST